MSFLLRGAVTHNMKMLYKLLHLAGILETDDDYNVAFTPLN